jgi:hypothetical protein
VNVGTNGVEQSIALGANDDWSETAVTWNSQPGAGRRFATWIPGTDGPVEIVVTPQVQEALAGDKQLTVQLYSLRNFGGSGFVDYAAREHPDVSARPQLRLVVAGAPARPRISGMHSVGASVAFHGDEGPPRGEYCVLTSTNLTLPRAAWTAVSTNTFDDAGGFAFGGIVSVEASRFYVLRVR